MSDTLKDMKRCKSRLGKVIRHCLPMIEEMVRRKATPFCLVGFRTGKDNVNMVHLITMHDSHDEAVYFMLKEYVQHYKSKYEKEDDSEQTK